MRRKVAAAVGTSTAVWGQAVGGKTVPAPQAAAFGHGFARAVLGARGDNATRPSRALRVAFVWGPPAHLGVSVATRLAGAMARWRAWRQRLGLDCWVSRDAPPARALCRMLERFGWKHRARVPFGTWDHAGLGWQGVRLVDQRLGEEKGLVSHWIRESWRRERFGWWMAQKKRRDSVMARAEGLHYTPELGEGLKALAAACPDAWARGVMVGGFSTEALFQACRDGGGRARRWCTCCGQAVVPSVHHVAWRCEAFAGARSEPEPGNGRNLAGRMGWDQRLELPEERALALRRLRQMAEVREEEVRRRRKRGYEKPWEVEDEEGSEFSTDEGDADLEDEGGEEDCAAAAAAAAEGGA
jgi:hypothetical protein